MCFEPPTEAGKLQGIPANVYGREYLFKVFFAQAVAACSNEIKYSPGKGFAKHSACLVNKVEEERTGQFVKTKRQVDHVGLNLLSALPFKVAHLFKIVVV